MFLNNPPLHLLPPPASPTLSPPPRSEQGHRDSPLAKFLQAKSHVSKTCDAYWQSAFQKDVLMLLIMYENLFPYQFAKHWLLGFPNYFSNVVSTKLPHLIL